MSTTDTDDAAKAAYLQAVLKNSFGTARQYLAGSSGTDIDGMGIGDGKSSTLNEMLNEILNNSRSDGNSNGNGNVGKGSRFSHATEFGQEIAGDVGIATSSSMHANRLNGLNAELDAEDIAARKERLEREEAEKEAELEQLREKVSTLTENINTLARTQGNSSARIRQLESELSQLLSTSDVLEKDILLKRKTLEMLPNAQANITTLQDICGSSGARLLQLAQEWEKHRKPLIDQIREIQNSGSDRRDKCRGMMEQMRSCKDDMSSMIADLKEKQDRARLLAEELSKLPKNINRALYTHRIMDIISSINKQNVDIERITNDIKNIQKTINLTSQTLSRSDHAAEELIYAAANANNSDVATVETYRALTTLRAEFENLLTVASSIGQQEKLARDLEVKVEQELTRVSSNNIERIRNDLLAVQTENADLVSQLKAM